MDNMISLKITQDGRGRDVTLPTNEASFENITSMQITDCVCPMLKGMDIKCEDISTLNNFAVQLRQISDIGKLPKLNAVLSANQCSSVDQAISLAERLEHFYFDAKIPRSAPSSEYSFSLCSVCRAKTYKQTKKPDVKTRQVFWFSRHASGISPAYASAALFMQAIALRLRG